MNHPLPQFAPRPPRTTPTVAWAYKLIFLAIVIIIVSTLYPFKFSFTNLSVLAGLFWLSRSFSSYMDVAANILLFAPLGFGLGGVLVRRNFRFLTQLLAIVLVCGLFSLAIEIAQGFLPGRKPTLFDVLANASGGGLGFIVFYYIGGFLYAKADWLMQRSRQLLSTLSVKVLIGMVVLYVLLMSWLVVTWQGSSLKNWYDDFPLRIGNNTLYHDYHLQQKVNTAWNGFVADVVIRDRAVTRSNVESFFAALKSSLPQDDSTIVAYSLRGKDGAKDLIGQSPDLIWQGTPAQFTADRGASVGAEHWLQSTAPVGFLTNRIRQTAQFTVSALVTQQTNPNAAPTVRPIIEIGNGKRSNNVSIAQFGNSMILVGVRQRKIGQQRNSNRHYEQVIPNLLADRQPHRIVITYSNFVTRVYVDSVDQMYVLDMTPNRYLIMLNLLMLLPLAVLIMLVASRVHHRVGLYITIIGVGTILPSLILESYLAFQGEREIRPSNLILGFLIVGGTILISKSGNKLSRRSLVSSH